MAGPLIGVMQAVDADQNAIELPRGIRIEFGSVSAQHRLHPVFREQWREGIRRSRCTRLWNRQIMAATPIELEQKLQLLGQLIMICHRH